MTGLDCIVALKAEKVLYIYQKQLEEADIIVISKADIMNAAQLEQLRGAISERYPRTRVVAVSARAGLNLDEWFNQISSEEQSTRATMPVDYDTYAEGEALLGWLNCTADIAAEREFSADDYLKHLAARIGAGLKAKDAEIAHLKMTFSPEGGLGNIAAANLVWNDFVPCFCRKEAHGSTEGVRRTDPPGALFELLPHSGRTNPEALADQGLSKAGAPPALDWPCCGGALALVRLK